MTASDFEKRDWVPGSGWPYPEAELAPYLHRAHVLCGSGPYGYDESLWQAIGPQALPFRQDLIHSHFWQMNNRLGSREIRFAKKFRAELRDSANIHVYLHANAVELLLDSSRRRIAAVRTRTLDGREGLVRARVVILASGGIENPRLLLASNAQRPYGIGNDHDLVGRYFHEHLEAPCAVVDASTAGSGLLQYARWWALGRTHARPGITLSPVEQARRQALNISISIDAVYSERYLWRAAKELWDDIVARRFTRTTAKNLLRTVAQPHTLLPDAYNRVRHGTRPMGDPDGYVLYARAEQAPNPDSRIRLGDDRDALGMPRVELDWRTSELDHRSFRVLTEAAQTEFARLGLGEVRILDWVRDGIWPAALKGGPHHMGATRMADSPREGVVDRHARVHGVDGLYVAGSSIFPTGGHANCTMTLVATTLKLCDHLETVLPAMETVAEREYAVAAG